MRAFPDPLPIDDILPRLGEALAQNSRAVLVAPPGAGKTTRVPLALLDEPFVDGRKIIVLEPRRLAARAAAQRMAGALGQKVGKTVGLRVRLQSLISSSTRIEVVTEGVFARMILDDPSLEGVAAVLFDEFHERSLDADLGLALALDAQGGLREDLRILVMSATLDGERVAALMEGAASLVSEGRAFPVETRYFGRDPAERIEEAAARAILTALREEPGSILAFLPGQAEILRAERILGERVKADNVDIAPLYGALDLRAQDLAVAPAPKGRRKIVLATPSPRPRSPSRGCGSSSTAALCAFPTSNLTSASPGWRRCASRAPMRTSGAGAPGASSRASAIACGRRRRPAACALSRRPRFSAPTSRRWRSTSPCWGVADPVGLKFLDPPPRAAFAEARALLASLGALDADGRLTDEGTSDGAAGAAAPARLAR